MYFFGPAWSPEVRRRFWTCQGCLLIIRDDEVIFAGSESGNKAYCIRCIDK